MSQPLLPPFRPLLPALLATALLAACGGGGGGSPVEPAAAPPVAPQQVRIEGRIADGPLAGAVACYDLNDNGRCDADEPRSAPSAADGSYAIQVASAAAGRHAVVAEVPADAVDADTGRAVGSAFTLVAPATGSAGAQAVFVSPLTTLVAAQMQAAGTGRSEAAAQVQQRAALQLSPLEDFTTASGDAARQAARTARLALLTTLAQRQQLAGVVGSAALDGQPVTEADLQREQQAALLAALPQLAGTLIDPALDAASGVALQAQLQLAARALAAQIGPDAAVLRAGGLMQRQAVAAEPVAATAGATLRYLRYTSATNFGYRMLEAAADDNVPDAQGLLRYYDWYVTGSANPVTGRLLVNGGPASAGSNVGTHWNGSAWVQRSAHQRFTTTARDALGRNVYNYGDGLEQGTGTRRVEDISGLALADVVQRRIRRFPGGTGGVAFVNWGPSDMGAYGTAVFPPGAQLIYQTTTVTATAPIFNQVDNNRVTVYSAEIAAGGDARANPGLACNQGRAALDATLTPVSTLEQMIARNRAAPCIYNQAVNGNDRSLDPNTWWGNSTLNLGDVAGANSLPEGTGAYYNTTASLRVSFEASGNRVSFWRCYRRASDASPRNCSSLGQGTWSIQTLGDARVLGFSVAPALAQKLGYARIFVERGGAVYYGNRNPVGTQFLDLRLNLDAAAAVLHQLGLPWHRPVSQPGTATGARAATLATLQGAWGEANPNTAIAWRFGPNGRFFLAEIRALDQQRQEDSGAELGWIDIDPATGRWSTLVEVDTNLSAGTSHPRPDDSADTVTVTADTISGGTGADAFSFSRLDSDASALGIVGMWALGSANDLSVPHIVFFRNGRVMTVVHTVDTQCAVANGCAPGVEYASWTWNLQTGALRLFDKLYDTNGCDGAFDSCAGGANNAEFVRTLVIAADGRSAALIGPEETQTLYRIAPR